MNDETNQEENKKIRKWRRLVYRLNKAESEKSLGSYTNTNHKNEVCRERSQARKYERIQDFKFTTLKKISHRYYFDGRDLTDLLHHLENINDWRDDAGIEPLLTILWNVFMNRGRCPRTNEMLEVKIVNRMRASEMAIMSGDCKFMCKDKVVRTRKEIMESGAAHRYGPSALFPLLSVDGFHYIEFCGKLPQGYVFQINKPFEGLEYAPDRYRMMRGLIPIPLRGDERKFWFRE